MEGDKEVFGIHCDRKGIEYLICRTSWLLYKTKIFPYSYHLINAVLAWLSMVGSDRCFGGVLSVNKRRTTLEMAVIC